MLGTLFRGLLGQPPRCPACRDYRLTASEGTVALVPRVAGFRSYRCGSCERPLLLHRGLLRGLVDEASPSDDTEATPEPVLTVPRRRRGVSRHDLEALDRQLEHLRKEEPPA